MDTILSKILNHITLFYFHISAPLSIKTTFRLIRKNFFQEMLLSEIGAYAFAFCKDHSAEKDS